MDQAEKRRRRNISRDYQKQHSDAESLLKYPVCGGTDWICDSCGRQSVGCGVKPFSPHRGSEMTGGTDPFVCDGYL